MTCIAIDIAIVEPIYLEMEVAPIYQIVPTKVYSLEPIYLASEAFLFQPGDKSRYDNFVGMSVGWGAKATGVDAGTLWQMSIDDDYLYICVYTGIVGVARWKKFVGFMT